MLTDTHRIRIYQRQRKECQWGADDDDVVFVVPQPSADLLKPLHEGIETQWWKTEAQIL